MGSVALPRVGQRVLMSFLAGDPDRPLVTGRVFTQDQRVPYALPAHKEVTSIRTESSPRGAAFPTPPPPGPRSSPLGGGTGMSMTDIARAVETVSAFAPVSPNGTTHRWNGSELSFSDVANNESVYLQAQWNFSSLVKHDRVATIGNTSAERIGGDHLMEIGNKQDIKVADDQTITVGGHHTLTVQKTLKTYSIDADQYHYAKESYGIRAKRVYAEADEELTLRVGGSVIFMRPDFIMIQSGHVYINPGADELAAAMETGVRPITPQEIADAIARRNADPAYQRSERIRLAVEQYIPEFRRTAMPGVDITPRPGNRNALLRQHLADRGLSPAEQDDAISRYWDRPSGQRLDDR